MSEDNSSKENQLYCDECEHYIGYEVTENGDKVILCARCSGECAFCHCALGEQCFESLKVKYTPRTPHDICEKKQEGK